VLLTEGRVTLVDALLAGSVLIGLVLNAALGWWWAAISFRIDAYSIRPGSSAVLEHRDTDRLRRVPGSLQDLQDHVTEHDPLLVGERADRVVGFGPLPGTKPATDSPGGTA